MTFEEAKILARQGVKMTHTLFPPHKYMTMRGNAVLFEDGMGMGNIDNWITPDKEYFNTGWSEFESPNYPDYINSLRYNE